MSKLRYSEFYDQINIDAFEDAIGFEVIENINDNDVGFCMFPDNHNHGDTTGKFGIHREKRVYNCYVCGGGSLLSLTMELYGYDVDDATYWLYQFCNADMRDDEQFIDDFIDSFRDIQKRIETLPYFNERVLDQYLEVPEVILEERGITTRVAEWFRLGYDPSLHRSPPRKGKYADDPEYVGEALVFPHFWKDRLVGWQTRWLEEERPDWLPKYTNTTDFPREETIWGYDNALRAKGLFDDKVVIVESVPSALHVISSGYAPAVSTFGSNVTGPQLRLLRRFSSGVIICPDADKPGDKWTRSLVDYLKRYIPVNIAPRLDEEDTGSDIGDIPLRGIEEYLDMATEYTGASV